MLTQAYKETDTSQNRYGKIRDLKAYAQAVNFLQERNVNTLLELQEKTAELKDRYWSTNKAIKQKEKLLHEQKERIDHAEKYLKYQSYHKTYLQTKPRQQEAYADKFRMELTLYDAAERYLKQELGKGDTIKLKTWKAEVATLASEKENLYGEVRKLKVEVQEAEAVKKCVEQIIPPQQSNAKMQNRKKDMEL